MSFLYNGSGVLRTGRVGISYSKPHLWDSTIMVSWDRKQTLPEYSISVSLTCILSVLFLVSHHRDMTWRPDLMLGSKSKTSEENWQGGGWHERTSYISTLSRIVQALSINGQSASVVQDNNTDGSSELFLIPLILQGVQQTSNIHQFTGDTTGKRQNFAPHINTQPHTVF